MSFLGSLGTLLGGVERQINPFDGGATYNNPNPQRQPISVPNYHPSTPAMPSRVIPSVAQASNIPHIQGQVQMAAANNNYQYSPMFSQIARGTAPAVNKLPQGVAGEYFPNNNEVNLSPNPMMGEGYVPTHEFLHAAYQRKTPVAQQAFLQMVQKNISPQGRAALSDMISGPLYGHQGSIQDFTQLPQHYATEIHSFLPLLPDSQSNPQLASYYRHYFSSPDMGDHTFPAFNGLTGKQNMTKNSVYKLLNPRPASFLDSYQGQV